MPDEQYTSQPVPPPWPARDAPGPWPGQAGFPPAPPWPGRPVPPQGGDRAVAWWHRPWFFAAVAIAAAAAVAVAAVVVIDGASPRGRPAPAGAPPPAAKPRAAAAPPAAPRVRSVAGHPKPYFLDNSMTNGDLGRLIDDRAKDSGPMTVTEVFGQTSPYAQPATTGMTLMLLAKDLSADCSAAVWGPALQRDLRAADCTQAARGMYASSDRRYVGMIAVFNLKTAAAGIAVASAMGPATVKANLIVQLHHGHDGYILPLAVPPAGTLGSNQDNEALAKVFGHYLVIEWSQGPGGRQEDDLTLDLVKDAMDNALVNGFLLARENNAFAARMNGG